MNILSYTNSPLDPKSGGGKMALMFSQGMRELGHNVEVCQPKDYELWCGFGRAIKFRKALGSWRSIGRKLKTRAGRYDIFEFCGDEFWLATWRLSKLAERPLLIAHVGGLELLAFQRMHEYSPPASTPGRLYDWFFRQTHERFSYTAFATVDAFVSLCELDRKHVLDLELYPAERTAVVEPGLDEEYLCVPFSPKREERIAFTGTWIPRKGVDKVSTVMAGVLSRNPNLYFDVYGTGGARNAILASFPQELHNRIIVHPKLHNKELSQGLARAKVFFFPTQYEGFGIALAEAMACGCAAVTTPTGFGAELRDGDEAFVCGFDDVNAMENSILRLLSDDNLRLRIAHKGRERVQSLKWETSARKLEGVYGRWIEEHRNGVKG